MSPNFRAASLTLDIGALGTCTATAVYHYRDRYIQSVILHRDDQRDLEVEAALSWFEDDDRIRIEQAVELDAMEAEAEAADFRNDMRREEMLFDREEARAINGALA